MNKYLFALVLAAAYAAPVRADECACDALCRKSTVPDCVRKCGKVCAQNEKKEMGPEKKKTGLDTQNVSNGHLPEGDLGRMSDEKLEEWWQEYDKREREFLAKCNLLKDDDPNYFVVDAKCKEGKNKIAVQKNRIKAEKGKRACADYLNISDEDYCTTYRCGPCIRTSGNAFEPKYKADARRKREQEEDARAKSDKEKRRRRSEGASGSVDCSGLLAKHQKTCDGLSAKTTPTRAACLANAKRAADAECAALKNLKANEGNR